MILLVFLLINVGVRANVIASAKQPKPRRPQHDRQNRNPATAPNDKALNAFLAPKIEIDAMLDRLKALSDDDFDSDADGIDWGDVDTLNHYASLSRQITDISECEFAK